MLDEEMDDIIKDASEQHFAPYDDKAWSKMENLLDKHLPQKKKDRRKFLLFLLLFLAIDAGVAFMIFYPHKKTGSADMSSLETKQSSTINNLSSVAVLPGSNANQGTPISNNADVKPKSTTLKAHGDDLIVNTSVNSKASIKIGANDVQQQLVAKNRFKRTTKAKLRGQLSNPNVVDDNQSSIAQSQSSNDQLNKIQNDNNAAVDQPSSSEISNSIEKEDLKKNDVEVDKKSTTINTDKKDTTSQKTVVASNTTSKKKDSNKFSNRFAFNISAGPGVSFVGVDYAGRTTISYGAGISYLFAKRFTVRTGFYVSKKIYTAQPSDYHPPKGTWPIYWNMQSIDANCKVYEIPLNVSYDFKQVKKHNWFVSAGLSSYLMKKEVYDYTYINQSGQQQYTTATIDNKNKNLFSVISISGGYKYQLTKYVSLAAEPFFEIPSVGVGFGKINLNSSGILFSAIIKPFAGK